MLRLSAVVLLFSILPAGMQAGEPLFIPHGAGQAGMAFASVASFGHWNSFHNQALMTGQSALSAGFSFESRFMMNELSSEALSVIIPLSRAPLGLVAVNYGSRQYSTFFTGLGSAVKISKGLSLGIEADFINRRSAGDYPDVSYVTFQTGLVSEISDKLIIGIHVFNPLYRLNSLPSSIRAGCSWLPSSDLVLSFETSKVTGEPLSVHGGIEWEVPGKITLRTGYISSPSALTFGSGYCIGPIQADIGFILNSKTGITSSVSFFWTINRK